MKKLLSIILVLTMVLGMLASCGDDSKGSSAGGAVINDLKDVLGDVEVDELPSNIDEAIKLIDKNATVYTGRLFNKDAKVIFKGNGAIAGYSTKSKITMESGKIFTSSVETLIIAKLVSEWDNNKELKVVGVLTKATLGGEGLDDYYAMKDEIFESLCKTYEVSEEERESMRKIFDDYIGGKAVYLKPADKAYKMITESPKQATLTLSENTFEAEYSWYDIDEDIKDEPNNDPDTELDVNGDPVKYDKDGNPIVNLSAGEILEDIFNIISFDVTGLAGYVLFTDLGYSDDLLNAPLIQIHSTYADRDDETAPKQIEFLSISPDSPTGWFNRTAYINSNGAYVTETVQKHPSTGGIHIEKEYRESNADTLIYDPVVNAFGIM